MTLRALRLRGTAGGRDGPEPCELGPDLALALSTAKAGAVPVVYLLRNEDLSALRDHRELVVDRGTKHPAKPLARLLLGHDRIPLVQGRYTSAGQLLRSVRTLLDHAVRTAERNVFVVGAAQTVFDGLWATATRTADGSGAGGGDRSPHGASPARPDPAAAPGSLLLELLARLPVPESVDEQFVGASVEVQLVRQLIVRAARQDDPVLILGDTGTGKEVVARLIHDQSPRRLQTFTPVNCGAIPRDLFESELFGYERGAHSTATVRKLGLWQMTRGGTLFLDEIADLFPDHQVKILRALDRGEVRPVGAVKGEKVDARVIAATNRDLFTMVQSGEFREDLYYRLRAFTIRSPALRDHPDDIPLLAAHFWKSLTRDEKARLPVEVVRELSAQRWPGNARELKLALSTLFGLFGKDGLTARHLRAVLELEGHVGVGAAKPPGPGEIGLHRAECLRHLRRVDEVLRAAKVSLRPVVGEARADDATVGRVRAEIRQRVNELELLCMRPLLFHGETTFSVVHRLKGKLVTAFRLLEGDAGQAGSYSKTDLEGEFRLASSTIFREVERLMREA